MTQQLTFSTSGNSSRRPNVRTARPAALSRSAATHSSTYRACKASQSAGSTSPVATGHMTTAMMCCRRLVRTMAASRQAASKICRPVAPCHASSIQLFTCSSLLSSVSQRSARASCPDATRSPSIWVASTSSRRAWAMMQGSTHNRQFLPIVPRSRCEHAPLFPGHMTALVQLLVSPWLL
jgi:hypothetical protein